MKEEQLRALLREAYDELMELNRRDDVDSPNQLMQKLCEFIHDPVNMTYEEMIEEVNRMESGPQNQYTQQRMEQLKEFL